MSTTHSIPGADAHFITLQKAEELTRRYRENRQKILSPEYQGNATLALSETFNRHALDVLLAEKECAAVRIYFGMDEALRVHSVLVGVTEKNEDILPVQDEIAGGSGTLVETAQRCPDVCPPGSPLNQP